MGSHSCAEQTVDVFLGPFCEDSRALYPTLVQLAKARGPATDIRVHLYPLPYNLGSWLPAQACTAAASIRGNSSKVFNDCISLLYTGENQKQVKNLAMINGSSSDVIDAVVSLFATPLGVNPTTLHDNLVQGLESGPPSYSQTKLSLKYGQSHGVFSTPSVMFNGIQIFGYDDTNGGLHAEGSFTELTVKDWQHLLELSV